MTITDKIHEIGLIKERYEIKELIGEGASSYVYKARDLVLNIYVTVKVLKSFDSDLTLESLNERIKFFRREYKLLERIEHPNVIRILDSGVHKHKYLFIIMEFLEGTTLSKIILDSSSFSLERIVCLFRQLAEGAQAIHSQGIIHRDLNPNNIWVNGSEGSEKLKILDFGTAKIIHGATDESYLQTITSAGKIVGTLYYLSPEQCRYQKLDEHTDIYSLGIIVYEMLSGSPPFNSHSPVMIAMGHMKSRPKEIIGLSKNIQNVVFKALEKEPQHRFATVIEFADAFEKAVFEQNSSAPSNLQVGANQEENSDKPPRLQKPTFWQTLVGWAKR
jgi:serine/threonine-protein kinase